ncbi:MAG TPA: hypothetical protein VNV37_08900 [Solirubrobacteraceae bacterium]|jgi:hypothetical protein|nr:hypothetical protein [Solirubrobacteraceae bacterium]
MRTIRILHHYEPGYGWSFDSPDIPELIGGGDSYDAAGAERAAQFALACNAEKRGVEAPDDLVFEHFVPAGVAVPA